MTSTNVQGVDSNRKWNAWCTLFLPRRYSGESPRSRTDGSTLTLIVGGQIANAQSNLVRLPFDRHARKGMVVIESLSRWIVPIVFVFRHVSLLGRSPADHACAALPVARGDKRSILISGQRRFSWLDNQIAVHLDENYADENKAA